MVYIIEGEEDGGLIYKIGTTRQDPRERMRQIRKHTRAPLRLVAVLIGDREDEKMFHSTFEPFHLRGEWFSDCLGIRAMINDFHIDEWIRDLRSLRENFIDFEDFYIKHTLLRLEPIEVARPLARRNIKENIGSLTNGLSAHLSLLSALKLGQ